MKCNKSSQLKLGIKTEMEHAHLFPKSKQKIMAKKIACDHLKESPRYYSELIKLENKLKRRKK